MEFTGITHPYCPVITPGLLCATGETTAFYKACHIDIDCGLVYMKLEKSRF